MGEASDASAIVRYFRENETHLAPFGAKKPDGFYTEQFWRDQLPKHFDAFKADQAVRLYLFNAKDGTEIIGTMEFSQIARGPFQACYLGYGIAKKHEGKGLMKEALTAAISYLFDELNIHRIMANYIPTNIRSAGLLKKLGFVVEGYAEKYLFLDGSWKDHVLTALTNTNWKSANPAMQLAPSQNVYDVAFGFLKREDDPVSVERGLALLKGEVIARPNDAKAWFEFAGGFDFLGREAEALPHYEKVLAMGVDQLPYEDRPRLFVQLGSTLRNLKKYDQATKILRDGIEKFPDVAALKSFLGLVEYSNGQYKTAAKLFIQSSLYEMNDNSIRDYSRALKYYTDQIDVFPAE